MRHNQNSFRRKILLISSLFLCVLFGFAQHGIPKITHYQPSDYNAMPENWAAIQGDNGLMYFGNIAGVLEYDGVTWNLIPLTNRSIARSLAKDNNGRIWVGGVGELGYLDVDGNGNTIFISIMDKIPEDFAVFSDVWTTNVINGEVFFTPYERTFVYNLAVDKMVVLQEEYGNSRVFEFKNNAYLFGSDKLSKNVDGDFVEWLDTEYSIRLYSCTSSNEFRLA